MAKIGCRKLRILLFALLLLFGISFCEMESVQAADKQITVTSCKLTANGKKVKVKAKVKKKTGEMGKKLYLLSLNAHKSENGTVKASPLGTVKTKKGKITFKVNYDSSMLYRKFVVAYKTGGKYKIASDARYITNPEVLATYKGNGPVTTSKKGLQVEDMSDALEAGTQHAVINWTLNSILNNGANNKIPYTYKGKTYYLDEDQLKRNDEQVQAYNAAGVKVTIILLLPKDASSTGTSAMQYGGYSYTKFSSFKTSTKAGCQTLEAVMTYLSQRYGTEQNLVSGWIIGNEVNSTCVWNYGGDKSLSSYMKDYARAFRICYNAVKSVSKNAKVYISLDHNWNKDIDSSGKRYFGTKATLDEFYKQLKAQGDISFQIAYHAYPQGLSDPVFWDDSEATDSVRTPIINFRNIKVLTNYAKKKFGKDCTIMLSEQSFNSNKGEAVQAAAYAYAYYISEGNNMIESFIYGREFDHPDETKDGYHWGLCDNQRNKRLLWNVFQYIDTKDSFEFTNPLLQYTNVADWSKVKGFKKEKFTQMPSKRTQAVVTGGESVSTTELKITWDRISTGDGYEIFRDSVQVGSVAGNGTVSYTDKKLTPGATYQYQVRMYKEAPDPDNVNKRIKLYGDLSAPVPMTVTAGQVEWNKDKCEVSGNTIKLAWKKLAGVSGYEICRATEENGTYTPLGNIAGDKNTYTDTQTVSGTTYYYKIRAFVTANGVNHYGKDSDVLEKQARIQLTVSIVDGEVVMNWSRWQDATNYYVSCTPASAINYERQKEVAGLTYSCTQYKNPDRVMTDFTVGEAYYFRVRAKLGDNTYSKYSNEVVLFITEPIGQEGNRQDPYTPGQDPYTPNQDPYVPGKDPYVPSQDPYAP